MKPRIQKIGCLLGVWLLTVGMFTTSLAAQETPSDKDSASGTTRTGPRFKAGDKVEAKRSGVWWYPGTIVSNQGGGKFMVRWDQSMFKNESVHQNDIRKPGEAHDPASQYGQSSQSGVATTPQRTITAQDFVVGEKLTWRSQGDTLTGQVIRVVSPRVLMAKRDSDGSESAVTIESITSKPASASATLARSSSKSPSGQTEFISDNTLYIQGQRIIFNQSSHEHEGVVVRDEGERVVVYGAKHRWSSRILRSAILTPANPKVIDPAVVKADINTAHIIKNSGNIGQFISGKFVRGTASMTTLPPGGVIRINNPAEDGKSQILPQRMFISPNKPIGTLIFKSRPGKAAHAITYDLKSGTQGTVYLFPGATEIIDVSPDADRVLTESGGFLSVWELDDKTANLLVKMEPCGEGTRYDPSADKAYLLPDNGLLVNQSAGEYLYMWRVTAGSAKAVWGSLRAYASSLTMSPKRTVMLSNSDVLDPQTGNHFAQIDSSYNPPYTFSPDGNQIATLDQYGRVKVFDIPSKKTRWEFRLQGGVATYNKASTSLTWVDNDFVVINDKYLLALATGLIVWEYTDGIPFQPADQGIGWALKYDGKGAEYIVASKIATDQTRLAVQAISRDSVYEFEKGDPVTIKYNVRGGPSHIEANLREKIEKKAAENNNPIVPDAPIVFTYSITAGPPIELVMPATRPHAGFHRFNWRVVTARFEVTKGGRLLFKPVESSQNSPVFGFVVSENETAQQAADSFNDVAYALSVENLDFPEYIYKPISQLKLNKTPMFPQ